MFNLDADCVNIIQYSPPGSTAPAPGPPGSTAPAPGPPGMTAPAPGPPGTLAPARLPITCFSCLCLLSVRLYVG